jgi:hypothetical protein
MQPHPDMLWVRGQFEKRTRGSKQPRLDADRLSSLEPSELCKITELRQYGQNERADALQKQVTHFESFTDTGVSPQQAQEIERLRRGELEQQRLVAEYNYGTLRRLDTVKEILLRDKLLAIQKKADLWPQQYSIAEVLLLKEYGFEEFRKRKPEQVEQWLCHQTAQAVWKKQKQMEKNYRANHAFMQSCQLEADKWLRHYLQTEGKVGEQFSRYLTSYGNRYSDIIREYHMSRPEFNPPAELMDIYESDPMAEGYYAMEEYIEKLEEAAESERNKAQEQAIVGAIKYCGRPLLKAEQQAKRKRG